LQRELYSEQRKLAEVVNGLAYEASLSDMAEDDIRGARGDEGGVPIAHREEEGPALGGATEDIEHFVAGRGEGPTLNNVWFL